MSCLRSLYRRWRRAKRRRASLLARTRRAERERIARELHDTLLQSVNALILRIDAIATQLPADAPVRASLENIVGNARSASREARDLIHELRTRVEGET